MENKHIIQIKDLEKTYQVGETQVHALRGVTFDIMSGEMLAIMGPSGSGKSTLMNIIGCLDTPTKGKYLLEGKEVSTYDRDQLAEIRNKTIGFVFQSFNLLARTSALDNVTLPLIYDSSVPKENSEGLAYKALESVGLKGREHHKTNQISGGEKQRVAIARALVNNPSLILADEPTGNLDTKTGNEIMKLFIDLNENRNITIILVTHDPEVAEIAHKIIYVRDGLIEKEQRR